MTYQYNDFVIVNKKTTSLRPKSAYMGGDNHCFSKTTGIGFITALFLSSILAFSSVSMWDNTEKAFDKKNKVVINFNGTDFAVNPNLLINESPHIDSLTPAILSENLRNTLGLNKSHWARILGVERKTLYNWKSNPNVNIQESILTRLNVLDSFSKHFRPEHKAFFGKILLGSLNNKELLTVFTKTNLDVDELLGAYDSVYAQLDGLVVRADLNS